MRNLLLAASGSPWLRRHAPRIWFVKKAVTRFMPGERLDDALTAAADLALQGIGTVLTRLGENVGDATSADEVTRHYREVLHRIEVSGLDCQVSVKLTQLGLDVDPARCHASLRSLVELALAHGIFVWIDMEQRTYVDATLEIYRRVLADFPNVGVCLQAYLYRTPEDLTALLPLGGGIRLVKGAYREPSGVAYSRKSDVDHQFVALAKRLVGPDAQSAGVRAVFGTHDRRMLATIERHLHETGTPPESVEFHLLFGIQRTEQARLAGAGYRVRVLISYGEQWFPWYMRRLAERPANVLFVVRSMLSN